MKKLLTASTVTFVLSMLLGTGSAFAHHSFASEYDASKPVTIKGAIVKFQWINPHSWLHIDVRDANGLVSTWAVEFGSPSSLLRSGFRKDDLPVGTEVTVTGHLARNGSKTVHSSGVKLANGTELFSGTPGGSADEK